MLKVLINPTIEESGSGVTSSFHWNSPYTIDMLNKLFNVKSHERIKQIEVNEDGITARIETVTSSQSR